MFSNISDIYYLLFIIMFEEFFLKKLHGPSIMVKRSKICGVYILDDPTIIDHASLANQDFRDKIKL